MFQKLQEIGEDKSGNCENELADLLQNAEIECIVKLMNLNIPLQLKNKSRIVKAICRFYLIESIVLCINDFKSGFNAHGILNFCKDSPKHFKQIFEYDYKSVNLSSVTIRELFHIDIKKSNDSFFQKKLKAMKFFFQYLDDCNETMSTFQDLLAFTTATDSIPFIFYNPRPSVQFDQTGSKFPTANTCSNILNLTTNCETYIIFKQNLDLAFTTVKDFGLN